METTSRKNRTCLLAALVAASTIALVPAASADHDLEVDCAVTPGGWGAPPRGENPGAALHDHWDEVFPNGLTVDGHFFEDPEDVTDALPASGDPLFNHAVALAINLAFGHAGLLPETLEGVEVSGGPFDGKTAEEILDLAEDALEDPDRSTSKYSDLIDALTGLNEEQYGCNEPSEEPQCPSPVTATANQDTSIDVDWPDVTGADSYNVYRREDGGSFSLVASPTDSEYHDTDTEVGVTYTYVITTVEDNVESDRSRECSASATAIPFFPVALLGAAAVVASVGAYALLRRRA